LIKLQNIIYTVLFFQWVRGRFRFRPWPDAARRRMGKDLPPLWI